MYGRESIDIIRTDITEGTSEENWAIVRNGEIHYRESDYGSLESALVAAFPNFAHGGYPIAYIGDGELYCGDCVRRWWRELTDETTGKMADNPDFTEQDETGNYVGDNDRCQLARGEVFGGILYEPSASGETCGDCGHYLPGCEPHCSDCVTDLDNVDGSIFYSDSGEHILCVRCLARMIVKGNAEILDNVTKRYRVYGNYLGGAYGKN